HGETQTKSAESEFAANKLSASDYLMWLEAQTSSLPPQPQAKSPDQAHSGKPAHSGAPAQSGASAQLAEESSLSAPAPPLMPQSDKAAAAAAAAAVAASKIAATQPATKPETKPAAKTRGRAAKSDSILSPPERDFLEGVPSAASASVGGASAESRVVSPKDGAAIQENEKEPSGLSGAGTLQLGRSECLAFAVGSIADVFGKDFKLVDTFPSRVRLPDEPLMFVDRVLEISGEPRSLKQGRIVTQHDLKSGEWCLENGRIIPGMAIESGQADLMLSAYLGIDFVTKGLAHYRLLDAEVVFHDHTPSQGQTATYDISINNFFSHDQTTMFRFEFIGSVGDKPILSMRRGCAGFFTPQALAAGKGLARKAPISGAAQILPEVLDFPGASTAEKLTEQELSRLRSGDCSVLGEAFKDRFEKPLLLPGGKLTLFDRVPQIQYSGGSFGGGFVRSEADIDPQAWFLTSHFVGDEVMPGTLMYDGCLQTLRVFLLSMGWIGCGESSSWQPTLGLAQKIKCRGQVTPKTKKVAYEIHLKKMDLTENSEPYAVAEAIMFSDGRPIVEVNNLSLCLAGTTAADLAKSWTQKPAGGSPARSSPARGRPRTSSKESAETEKTVKASSKKSVQQAAETGKSPVSVRRQIKAVEFYDKAALTEISSGLLSKAFGPLYARFDDGSFVARLPQAPYDFIDEATVKKGRLGQVAIGAQVEATYNLSRDNEQRLAFLFQSVKSSLDSRQGALPYAALNEIALQPCGFLAAYMGSALSFNVPMHFRNLGGEAVVRGDISPLEGPIATKATLTKASVLGTMAIQHYQFTCSHQGKVVYEGQTHFGFHDIESLTSPDGLKGQTGLKKALIANMSAASPIAYPQGPAWPVGQWRMLDSICRDPKKEGRMWGMVKVDPKAWFFTAHFPNDPVWPGSLGLEAFLQVAKVLAAAIFFADVPLEDLDVKWTTPVKETNHRWLYRGQITPRNSDVTFGIKISWSDAYKKILSFRGLMWVDGLVVYQIEDLTVQCG
ncbi:MAG: hypothetical protein LBT62_05890, partial [Deltaproteobacteria bacterium]|nr:hypothetical protein [Deltaproteobacteria bacterium]